MNADTAVNNINCGPTKYCIRLRAHTSAKAPIAVWSKSEHQLHELKSHNPGSAPLSNPAIKRQNWQHDFFCLRR